MQCKCPYFCRQSDSVKSRIQIPRNNLGEKPVSDSNIAKKSLQTPKLLVGKSNAGKKLMISGPSSENELRGLDGRPKSSLFYSATDISRLILKIFFRDLTSFSIC